MMTIDPSLVYAAWQGRCKERTPSGEQQCHLDRGHSGLHVAHMADGKKISWLIDDPVNKDLSRYFTSPNSWRLSGYPYKTKRCECHLGIDRCVLPIEHTCAHKYYEPGWINPQPFHLYSACCNCSACGAKRADALTDWCKQKLSCSSVSPSGYKCELVEGHYASHRREIDGATTFWGTSDQIFPKQIDPDRCEAVATTGERCYKTKGHTTIHVANIDTADLGGRVGQRMWFDPPPPPPPQCESTCETARCEKSAGHYGAHVGRDPATAGDTFRHTSMWVNLEGQSTLKGDPVEPIITMEIDGPPRAYFELEGRRIIYKTLAFQCPDKATAEKFGEEMLTRLRRKLADVAKHRDYTGDLIIWWRKRPELELQTKGENKGLWYWRCRVQTTPSIPEHLWSIGLTLVGEGAVAPTIKEPL